MFYEITASELYGLVFKNLFFKTYSLKKPNFFIQLLLEMIYYEFFILYPK